MEMTVRMPANYNLMTEDEMTYTEGGSVWGGVYVASNVVSWVLTGVMVVNWLDLLGGARRWYAANKTNDYTSSSAWNAVRSIAATVTAIGGTILIGGVSIPYGLIGTAAALLTA